MVDITKRLSYVYDEVTPQEFYRTIFPLGELERKGEYVQGKYNGIIVEVTGEKKINSKPKILRHTLTDDLDKIDEVISRDNFCIMSPISYAGKTRKSEFARYMYAMAIDVDGIKTEKNFDFLMAQIKNNEEWRGFVWGIPTPSYIVSSGTGIHLYYVFESPIPLYKNVVKELEKLKNRITWQAWTQGASVLSDNVQYESLFQGFRIPGTITKKETRAKAFVSGEKITVEYLNHFVPKEYTADIKQYKSKLTIEEAKTKYPEWYQKRVIQGQPKGTWKAKKTLYDWWIRKTKESGRQGHRYWCIMALAAYAKKCGVDYDTLFADAVALMPYLDSIGDGTDPFTIDDVLHALEAYNDSYITYPIDTISYRTDIPIQKNKRNGRKQDVHLKIARATRDILHEDWREGNGRPKGSGTAEKKVKAWRQANPQGSKSDCHRDTNLDPKTIRKWWEGEQNEQDD